MPLPGLATALSRLKSEPFPAAPQVGVLPALSRLDLSDCELTGPAVAALCSADWNTAPLASVSPTASNRLSWCVCLQAAPCRA